jgi:hypothetical protein
VADLSGITAVRPTSNTVVVKEIYGATVSAGQPLYRSTESKWLPADCDLSAAAAAVKGVAITPGVLDGYGLIATDGSIILVGTTMVVAETYIASDTAGGIKPIADKATGDYVTYIGNAATATQLDLDINATGNQAP